jgi:arylsulfatase A-like enzyme
MGDHGIFEKCVLYEEAVRVPLLIRAPWLAQAPRRVPGPSSQIDLVPTLLELLGAAVPVGLPGASRAPVLSGQVAPAPNDVVIEWNGSEWRPPRPFARGLPPDAFDAVRGPWRTLIGPDGWKLNLSPADQCELYDLNTDPHECTNSFDDRAQRGRVRAMTARLRDWQSANGDTMPLPAV